MTALIVESSVWAVAEQAGWLVLKAQRQLEALDEGVWMKVDALDLELAAEAGLTGPVREAVVSPLVPADCLPHPCPNCGGSGIGSDYQGSVTTCGYRRQFEKSGAIVLGWTCPEHINDCPRAAFVDDGPCGTCGGSGTVAEPFYLGPVQRLTRVGGVDPEWRLDFGGSFDPQREERRQALLATAVITSQPIPVVEGCPYGEDQFVPHIDVWHLSEKRPTEYIRWLNPDDGLRLTEPLAGLVSPGDVVVRVELTPLEEPITTMREQYIEDEYGDDGGPTLAWDSAPLDLPLGVFTKEEQ